MGKQDITELKTFLKPYPFSVQKLALWLRDFDWDLYPESNELIYDNISKSISAKKKRPGMLITRKPASKKIKSLS